MPERFLTLPAGRRRAALIIVFLIAATIVFIWSNSLQSPESSLKRSDLAEHVVRPIILAVPVDAWHSDDMVTFITRKLGHFSEYFLLGAELMVLAFILRPVYQTRSLLLLLFAVCVASVDEALQLTSGRGAAVKDVLLDSGGALAGLLFLWSVLRIFAKGKTEHA